MKTDKYTNTHGRRKNSRFSPRSPAGLVGLLLLLLQPAQVPAGGEAFNLAEVSPGNFLHKGVHAGLNDANRDDIANIGFIVGEKCVAVIDSGGSLTTGKKLLQALRDVTDKPVCYVINTHVHFDHVLGNAVFREDSPVFAGHAQLADAIASNREFFLEQFAAELGPEPTAELIVGPDLTVSDSQRLDLGNRQLILTAWPKSHTHADLTVFDEKTGTLWAGDLIFRERIPVLDGSLKGWLASLAELAKLDINYTVPGHGEAGAGWTDVASAQIDYLNVLLDETRQAIADGLFLEEAQTTVGQGEKDKWLLFDEHHHANVSRAFVELEWE